MLKTIFLITSFSLLSTPSFARIPNGSLTNNYPAVIQLIVPLAENERLTCTATVISPDTILTAAHCVCGAEAKQLVRLKVSGDRTVYGFVKPQILVHKKSSACHGDETTLENSKFDLALIQMNSTNQQNVFKEHIFAHTQKMSFLERDAMPGDSVELIGYGATIVPYALPGQISELDEVIKNSIEKKRIGTNIIFKKFDGLLEVHGFPFPITEEGVITAPGHPDDQTKLDSDVELVFGGELAVASIGDSGSPLLIDGKIAGILSQTHFTEGKAESVYVDLSGNKLSSLLKEFRNVR